MTGPFPLHAGGWPAAVVAARRAMVGALLLLFGAGGLAAGETPEAAAIRALMPAECKDFLGRLPQEYLLYAGGAHSGKSLGFQIDATGEATKFDVYVNEPERDVVLVLGAHAPSVWNIQWTPGTRIAGVFVSGYNLQQVAGLEADVPILKSMSRHKVACTLFYMDDAKPQKSDQAVRQLFGRSAQAYYIADNGRLDIGQAVTGSPTWEQSKTRTVESFRDSSAPLARKAGLQQLIREGKLRPATEQDLTDWLELRRQKREKPSLNVVGKSREPETEVLAYARMLGAYVVLGPMKYPPGLSGAHSVTFIIPQGVPRPEGDPEHSAVLDMNTASCEGFICQANQI